MRRYFQEVFDEWLTRAAGIVFVLIVVLTLVSVVTDFGDAPLLGVFVYSMVPILFIAGGVIFVLAILRS